MPEINMPKLSDTMEEGTVLDWKKKDGETVKKGDIVAEIETDKASFEIEADADGVLKVVVETGKAVPVGEVIGRIGDGTGGAAPAPGGAEAGEAKPAEAEAQAAEPSEPKAQEPEPAADSQPEPEEASEADKGPEAESPAAKEVAPVAAREPESEPARRQAQTRPSEAGEGQPPAGVKASPIARRLAGEMGVDLASVQGSGPEGRIVKEDVIAAAGQRRPARPAARAERPAAGAADIEVEELTRMQATIARRMTASKTTVPHFYVTVEARVDDATRLRQQLKETVPAADRLTMTDMLVRACALALLKFPEVNSSWVDGRFERKRSVSIGLAVPPATGLGLLVPVIHDCDRKDLIQISIEARQVIERARSGKPGEGDLSGGTFSISNLGMYGVDEFSAIINPPESAILAVGAIKDVALVDEGQLKVGKVMRMTLSVDHRVFYGHTAALFMAEVRRLIENPVSLVLPPEQD